MDRRQTPMFLPTMTTLISWVRRAARRHRFWSVLVLALGVAVPAAVEAAPGIEFSDEALHGTRVRARVGLIRSDRFVSRVTPTIRVGFAPLRRRALLELAARPIVFGARKIPATVGDSPSRKPDH